MPTRHFLRPIAALIVTLSISAGAATAQTVVRSGFNIFSASQDVEIGKQSAAQVERQLPMLSDPMAQRYVSALGARLAAQAPGPKYTYQFKVANLSDVNAFALPGGFIYIHRGLLRQVRNEGELAGVISHEIAHVALRHPTNQASKAYLAQAGLGVLGGLLGSGQSTTSQMVSAIGGFGMNTLFLKFSRSAESQADIVGSQIMARAGYDPMDMARFFAYLGQQAGRDPGKVARFLSDHPAPADREARVRQEATLLGSVRRAAPVGSLASVQTRLGRLAPAPTTAQIAQNAASGTAPDNSAGNSIEAPSAQFRTFRQPDGKFTMDEPTNWTASPASDGYGVTFLPRGGIETNSRGQQNIAYGVIVNHFVPFDGAVGNSFIDPQGNGSTQLEQATSDLVRQVQQGNPYLRRTAASDQRTIVAGAPSIRVRLAGQSPQTGRNEQVTIVTRELADGHIVYVLLIAPSEDFAALQPTFDRMIRSLQINEGVAHN